MRRKIRDLDFSAIVARIREATDPRTRTSFDSLIQGELSFVKSPEDALESARNGVLVAILDHTKQLADIRFDDPLVVALVRFQNHPRAQPIPSMPVERMLRGPDAGPRLRELAAAHPELDWNPDAVQGLLIRAIRAYPDQVVENSEPCPIGWGPANAAAYALKLLVTLRSLGDL
ncbi:MAG TPA: hypothetical protein VGG74_03995 [Kofleriaceae bacterium]|jgi:hypothetical protein